jgi:hypothetical protein
MDFITIKSLLIAVVLLLFLILIELWRISARTRERFPTEKEADHDFAMRDPIGHWEARKDDKK